MSFEVVQQHLFFVLGGDCSALLGGKSLNVDFPSTSVCPDMKQLRVSVAKTDPG
jgi:hypothetical protein